MEENKDTLLLVDSAFFKNTNKGKFKKVSAAYDDSKDTSPELTGTVFEVKMFIPNMPIKEQFRKLNIKG